MEQDVALADVEEQVALLLERDDGIRREPLVAQVGPVDLERERHEAREYSGPSMRKTSSSVRLNSSVSRFTTCCGNGAAPRGALRRRDSRAAARHDGVQKVLHFFLVEVEVAVARDGGRGARPSPLRP